MKKTDIKKLDKLVAKMCKEEAKFQCELCGKSGDECQLHPHHYIGRRNRALRWYLPNLIVLCASHHTMGLWSAHQNPEWFRGEMLNRRGKEWLKDITQKARLQFRGTYQEVLGYLEGGDYYAS